MTPNHCIFCGQDFPGGRSEEHVIPQWLQKELSIKNTIVFPILIETNENGFKPEPAYVRRHTFHGLIEGRVCKSCNCGWMSKLEELASPVLLPLINRQRLVEGLGPAERLIIARWAAKTAYVLNRSANFKLKVPDEHLRAIYAHHARLPKGMFVLAQQHRNTEPASWIQSASWNVAPAQQVTEKVKTALATRSYKIAIQLGTLLLLVAYSPSPNWKLALWRGIHTPFWPEIGKVGFYDREESAFPFSSTQDALLTFFWSVHLVHTTALHNKSTFTG